MGRRLVLLNLICGTLLTPMGSLHVVIFLKKKLRREVMPYKAHAGDLLEEERGVEKGTEREAETSPWGQECQKRKREGGKRE